MTSCVLIKRLNISNIFELADILLTHVCFYHNSATSIVANSFNSSFDLIV